MTYEEIEEKLYQMVKDPSSEKWRRKHADNILKLSRKQASVVTSMKDLIAHSACMFEMGYLYKELEDSEKEKSN